MTDFAFDASDAGRSDLALKLLEPLTARFSDNALLWQLLALAHRDEQENGEAHQAFTRAAALAPKDFRIALGKAQVALEAGFPAARSLQQLHKAAPDDGELALSAAAACVQEGDWQAGEAVIEAMLARFPDWLRGHAVLAKMRWEYGQQPDFDRSYEIATNALPKNGSLYAAWSNGFVQTGQTEKAVEVLERGQSHAGSNPQFDAIHAWIASERGYFEVAADLYASMREPDDPFAATGAIRNFLRLGEWRRAADICERIVSGPDANQIWPYATIAWRKLGNERAEWLDGAPPFYRVYDLPLSGNALSQLADYLRRQHKSAVHPPEQTLRGGTQTDGHLLLRADPEIRQLRMALNEAVRHYVFALPGYIEGHPLLGTAREKILYEGAWSVRLAAQGFHVRHTHPAGWISSVLYISLPDPAQMGAAPAGWLDLGAPPPELGVELDAYDTIEPKPGRLVLFPSTMWHSTIPFADGERLTVAFDVRTPVF